MNIYLNNTEQTATHLLYDGNGWIEATRVWLTFPEREIDGVQDGWGWTFRCSRDLLRWLES